MGSSAMSEADATYIDYPLYDIPPVPAASTVGRWDMYGDTDGSVYLSINGAPYVVIATGATGVTLDGAYDFGGAGAGRAIIADAGAVTITNNGAANALLQLTDARTATNALAGLSWTRGIAPALGAIYTGSAIAVLNTPLLTNNSTEASPALVSITHLPLAGAGVVVDTTLGLLVSIQANNDNDVMGVQVLMGSTTNTNGYAAKFSDSSLLGHAAGNGLVNINHNRNGAMGGPYTFLEIGSDTATMTLGALTTGVNVNLATNITSGAAQALGVKVAIGASSNSGTSAFAATSAQTSGSIASITATGAPSAQLAGLTIDMSGTTASGTQNAPCLSLVGSPNIKTKTTSQACFQISGRASFQSAMYCTVRNTSALSGSLWFLGWDTTNFAGAVANTTLVAQTHMVTLDGSTNVTAGAQEFVNLRILTPATTNTNTRAITISTAQTAGVGISQTWTGVLAANSAGFAVSTGTNLGGFEWRSYYTSVGSGAAATLANTSSCFLGAFYGTTTTTGIFFAGTDGSVLTTTSTYVCYQARFDNTLTLGGTLDGLVLNLVTNVVGNGQQVRGIQVYTPTGAATSSYAAQFDMRGLAGTAAGNGIVNIVTNVNGSTTGVLTMLEIGSDTASLTLGAALTGINCNMATNIVPGAQAVTGLAIALPASTNVNTNGVSIVTLQKTGSLFVGSFPGATTLTGITLGLNLDLVTNVTGNGQQIIGFLCAVGAGVATSSYCGKFDFESLGGTAAGNGIVNINFNRNGSSTGVMTFLEMGVDTASLTLGAALTGINLDLATNVIPGAQQVQPLFISLPASTSGSTCGIVMSSLQKAGFFASWDFAGATTLSSTLIGWNFNLANNVTAGAIQVVGIQVIMPDSSNASTVGLGISTKQKGGYFVILNYAAATTLTGSATGIALDMASNVTNVAQIVQGLTIGIPTSSSASTRGIYIASAQTGAASDGIEIVMTPGSTATVVGVQITMGANSSGAALSITHNSVANNANQMVFTTVVDGTGAHIRGPTAGDFVIKSGINTGTTNGRSITVTASDGSTTGAGGSVNLNAGAIAGANQNGGDIGLTPTANSGAGVRGLVSFNNSASAIAGAVPAVVGNTGGATGPAVAAQNQWLAVKIAGVINYIPAWQ